METGRERERESVRNRAVVRERERDRKNVRHTESRRDRQRDRERDSACNQLCFLYRNETRKLPMSKHVAAVFATTTVTAATATTVTAATTKTAAVAGYSCCHICCHIKSQLINKTNSQAGQH